MTSYLMLLSPELLLIAAAALAIFLGLSKRPACRSAASWAAIIAVSLSLLLAWRQGNHAAPDPTGIRIAALAGYVRMTGLAIGLLTMLVNLHLPESAERGEYSAMLLFSLAGLSLVAASDDLITLFLALELVSIPTYILVATGRADASAREAAMKYLFLGSLAAAILLYGFSFLYGVSGTCALSGMTARLDAHDPYVLAGTVLVIAGIAYKMAAIPFHLYALDVYQGAASAVVGWIGFAPKMAGLIALLKVLALLTPVAEGGSSATQWNLPAPLFWLLWIMAAGSMTVGNCLALRQSNAKRLLACSGIAHTGYLLVAVLAGPILGGSLLRDGWMAALFYAGVYGLMNLGAFACFASIRIGSRPAEEISDLSGLARRYPATALALALCLFSLMGMPPTAGFIGKVFIFSSALSAGDVNRHPAMIVLTIVGVLNAAVAAAYYLRVIGACYLSEPQTDLSRLPSRALRIGLAACSILILLAGVRPQLLTGSARKAAQDVRPFHAPTIAGNTLTDPHPAVRLDDR